MTMPGFGAASSLGPNADTYLRPAVSGGAAMVGVPQSNLDSTVMGAAVFRNTITCCRPVGGPFGTHPLCRTYDVPFFENCRCVSGFPVCTPRVIRNL